MVSTLTASGLTTAHPPQLRVADVSFRYASREGWITALQHCSLVAPGGAFTCLVGPSGCGKSTLLDLVAGLKPPTEGSIQVAGEPVTGPRPDMAMVFQQPALFPWKTVVGNVTVGLRARGVPKAETVRRALDQLEVVGLSQFARAYPHELSGGMAQRVGLARALVLRPAVLLMDEPFAAVDAQTRTVLQEELRSLLGVHRMTVLFVTHDVGEAVYLGDRIAVMAAHPGRVIREVELAPESADRSSPYFARTTASILSLLAHPKEIHEQATP